MARLVFFLKLSRPHFLVGGALLYFLGVATWASIGVGRYLLGQLMVSSAQITAHYVNEYTDLEVDRSITNRTLFSGGSGVLVEGKLSPRVAWQAAVVSSTIAVVAAMVIGADRPITAFIGLLALSVSWAYSMPPVRLLGTGWGELATTTVVAVLVPLIGVTITGFGPTPALWWSIGILVPIHMAMMLVFELPDLESDRAGGKMVLGARIGAGYTRVLIFVLISLGALVGAIAYGNSDFPPISPVLLLVAAAIFLTLLTAMRQSWHQVATLAAVTLFSVVAGILAMGFWS